MEYMVRLRDVVNGSERWLDETGGRHFSAKDRKTADCMALAMSRYAATELAYVVEVDPRFESV